MSPTTHAAARAAAGVLALLAVAAAPLAARSQPSADPRPQPEAEPDWRVTLSAGVAVGPDYLGSKDYRLGPLASVRVARSWFFVEATPGGARANLSPIEGLTAGPLVRVRGGRDDVRSRAVDALPDIDAAIELGGFVAWRLGPARLSLEAAADVSGAHDGWTADLAADWPVALGPRWAITPRLALGYVDDRFADAFFSVAPAGARASGLPAFAANGGVGAGGGGVALSWQATERISAQLSLRYVRLLGDLADSPVTDKAGSPDQFGTALGLAYRF